MKWSTGCAAVCEMRRPPYEGQKPRRLPVDSTLACLRYSKPPSVLAPRDTVAARFRPNSSVHLLPNTAYIDFNRLR